MAKRPREDSADDAYVAALDDDCYTVQSAEQWWQQTWGLFCEDDSPQSTESPRSAQGGAVLNECLPMVANPSHRIEDPASATAWVDGAITEYLNAQILAQQDTDAAATLHGHDEDESPVLANKGLICFGMIYNVPSRLTCDLTWLRQHLISQPKPETHVRCTIIASSDFPKLVLGGSAAIAQLCKDVTATVHTLLETETIVLEALVEIEACVARIARCSRPIDAITQVDINVYGAVSVRDTVGDLMCGHKVYLQHPKCIAGSSPYDNPHMAKFAEIDSSDEICATRSQDATSPNRDQIARLISDIFLEETNEQSKDECQHDLPLRTSLLPHQEHALKFMIQREMGTSPQDSRLWTKAGDGQAGYRHAIVGIWAAKPGPEAGFGILADDMGMGKTASTLCLIIHQLEAARSWAAEISANHTGTKRTRGTLVVVPSLVIMDQWLRELDLRFKHDLKIRKYHGPDRTVTIAGIGDADIVFSTYHTLAADRKAKTPGLHCRAWARIVLDEAHIIRQQSTQLFAAVAALEASHRWCLTGTPTQNRLEDLGSLLAFMRMEPLDRASCFRRTMIAPFQGDKEAAAARLRQLLAAVCLRRKVDRLGLVPPTESVYRVQLSSIERTMYAETLRAMDRVISHGHRGSFKSTVFGRFQIQLQLRLICNHGTFQPPYDVTINDRQTQSEEALHAAGPRSSGRCTQCHERTALLATNCASLAFCQEQAGLLCIVCAREQHVAPGANLYDHSMDRYAHYARKSSKLSKRQFLTPALNAWGTSAKISALMDDLRNSQSTDKSIIFSCWTRTLDLVARHLQWHGFCFVRIDGDTAAKTRQAVLNEFVHRLDNPVLLMTTGTGAYGLNLDAANRIFIMEPQWNPSVEIQAIGRAQRYGQTRPVQVVRYIVQDSIEEDVRRQQVRKRDLLPGTLEKQS